MAPREVGDTAKVRRAPGVSADPATAGVLTGAPPLRQAGRLATLPADLLPRIVAHIWACRPARPAAEEVRHAASLFGVCRRMRDALRAEPLPLALDFSAAPLSEGQRAWLAAPVRLGRIESAACFRPWRIASDEEERLWRGGHEAFLARHGRSLLRLTGVPLRLVATFDPSAPPALDLSGLRLTTLGVDCAVRRADRRRELWLAPGFMPQSLAELELRGVGLDGKGVVLGMGWATHPALRPDARVPALQRISVSGETTNTQLNDLALLQGLAAAPALSVDSGRHHLAVNARLLERVRSLHLRGDPVCLDLEVRRGQYEGLARSMCRPGLQSVTLEAAADAVLFCFQINPYALSLGYPDAPDDQPHTFCAVLRALLARRAGRFAFEVGPLPGERSALRRLAWRAWPPRGSPAWPAAAGAHARAAAWADEPDSD